ncbi:Aerotaxis receptor [Planctomycetes bacterium CA13]|uniref:Aerotaxis receptor n=1 Tax=Novipirellula herctigrandis TaxID=2527986 RepID=A0A5C5Z911_9BACT|nr:Aerotaxis receptor [Planctomycetes bacterium CA13]
MQDTAEDSLPTPAGAEATPRITTKTQKRIIDEERRFLIDELFFSTTDEHGVIRHGNEVFSRIAGIEPERLYGSPHSIIRHPDMPRVVFKLLWEAIQNGRTIAAYVKNLASDGRHYWVLAVVMPSTDGYLSVRLKPSSVIFPKVVELYARLREIEREIEQKPKQREAAMKASALELQSKLSELGFASYDDFMREALSVELCSRQEIMRKDHLRRTQKGSPQSVQQSTNETSEFAPAICSCVQVDALLQDVFDRLDEFKSISLRLGEKSVGILDSADTIRILAMNAAIAANKLGPRAGTLRVVSESLGSVSKESSDVINELASHLQSVVSMLNQLIFDVAATKLQSEISLVFMSELGSDAGLDKNDRVMASVRTLFEQMSSRVQYVFENLAQATLRMNELESPLENLDSNNRTLRFIQFTGKKESSGWSEAHEFAVVLEEVPALIAKTKEECDWLNQSIQQLMTHLNELATQQNKFAAHLGSLNRLTTSLD